MQALVEEWQEKMKDLTQKIEGAEGKMRERVRETAILVNPLSLCCLYLFSFNE